MGIFPKYGWTFKKIIWNHHLGWNEFNDFSGPKMSFGTCYWHVKWWSDGTRCFVWRNLGSHHSIMTVGPGTSDGNEGFILISTLQKTDRRREEMIFIFKWNDFQVPAVTVYSLFWGVILIDPKPKRISGEFNPIWSYHIRGFPSFHCHFYGCGLKRCHHDAGHSIT